MGSVLLTNFYGDMGGGEFALLEHARYLVEHGARVNVLLFHHGPFVGLLEESGCEVTVIPQRLDCGPRGQHLLKFRLLPKLKRLIKSTRPDYVMSYTLSELPFVASAANSCSVPTLFRDQGAPRDDVEPEWRELQLPEWTASGLAGVITTTTAESEALIERGAPKHKVRKVLYAVNTQDGGNVQLARQTVAREFDIPDDASIAGIFGRLVEWKGQSVFLEAIARCTNPNVFGLVVGGTQLNEMAGPRYEQGLRQLAEDLSIADRIRFTGFRRDTLTLMAACDVVCHASVREPFGLVVVEAMMCGKPIIASDVSGPRESMVHDETGYLVSVGDSKAMAQYIDRLTTDKELARRLGANGRKRALEMFDRNQNLVTLEDTIRQLIEARFAGTDAK